MWYCGQFGRLEIELFLMMSLQIGKLRFSSLKSVWDIGLRIGAVNSHSPLILLLIICKQSEVGTVPLESEMIALDYICSWTHASFYCVIYLWCSFQLSLIVFLLVLLSLEWLSLIL